MAKKKKKKQSEAIKLQKLANKTAIQVQNLVNSANQLNMEYNKKEAELARSFNASEAEKTRIYNTQEATVAREFNQQEANTARAFNAEEAQKARDWQTMMSNTAHQREVDDLKKAGLNPVLAVNNGAQSYTTSSANAGAASSSAASGANASGSAAYANLESGAAMFTNLMSGLMSSMSALKQTQMQNDSALRVAGINAAANKYATDVSANTARYVANTNLEASKYGADMSYRTAMDKPQSSWAALADKYFGSGLVDLAKKYIKDKLPNGLEFDGEYLTNFSTWQKLYKSLGIPDYKVTDYDYGYGNKKGHGKGAFFKLVCKAVLYHDPKSIYDLAKYQVNNTNINLIKSGHRYTGVQQ